MATKAKKDEKPLIDVQIIDQDINIDELIASRPSTKQFEVGEIVKGKIIDFSKNRILVDLGGSLSGIILGREVRSLDADMDNYKPGVEIEAMVIKSEDDEGYVVLSIRQVSISKAWDYLESIIDQKAIIEVKITEVNKGGLLFDYQGIRGFLPVSQLMPKHYPRVSEKDQSKIVSKLMKLKGKTITTAVMAAEREQNKLILSERKAYEQEVEDLKSSLEVGKVYDGTVTGFSNFGIFVTFQGVEGLVHLSEISWGKVKNPRDFTTEGDAVQVMLIGFNDGRISLSMKRLQADPWMDMAKNYKLGERVEGNVTRIEKYGYFMELANGIEGLVHISQISCDKVNDIHKFVKVGDKKSAEIILLDFDGHQIGLSEKKLVPKPENLKEKEDKVKSEKDAKEDKPKKTTAKSKSSDEESQEDNK